VVSPFALSGVADDLLVQRSTHGPTETEAPLLLDGPTHHTGYWAVVGLYASTSFLVYRARGFRDGTPRVQGVPTAIAPLIENLQSVHFSLSLRAGPGAGPGACPGAVPARFLAAPFGIQLAVA
jgi:hypothetical protein